MHTQIKFVNVGVLTAVILGLTWFVALPAFAQIDDYKTGIASNTYCPQLSQTIVRGSRGNQVLELQKFLSDYYDIPSTAIQTEYFGPITQRYVIQFQKEQGLPSYGIAGSMTRAAIAKVCGDVAKKDDVTTLAVTPTTGSAPLAVSFSARSESNILVSQYYIDFGDGTQAEMQGISGICKVGAGGPCNGGNNMLVSHTYSKTGTYTATLNRRYVCNTTTGQSCAGLYSEKVASVKISVN